MKQRLALDASVLTSIVNSDDVHHIPCYSYFVKHHEADTAQWVIPGLIIFEYQATQSRRYRERRPGKPVFRFAPLYVDKCQLYHITQKFLHTVDELKLYDLFNHLKGADLLYACIAKVEDIPLVTHDKQFNQYRNDLRLINPCEL
jgi:predicted nucleic acid-binding protein